MPEFNFFRNVGVWRLGIYRIGTTKVLMIGPTRTFIIRRKHEDKGTECS